MKKQQLHITIIITLLIFYSSCSTKKKTYVHRKYHDITARYNGYFNGKESLKYGLKKIEKEHKNDYSKILTVFKTKPIYQSKTHHAYMDKAIKKGSKVIQKHSINIGKKEYCKWIDDSYFLIAQSYFYKAEFLEAKKTFEYIKNNYKKTDIAYESKLWIVRCYIEMEKYLLAESMLDELRIKKQFPKNLQTELHLIRADLHLRQNLTSEALDELKSACNIIKGKNKKARYHYIIAQIYQEAYNKNQAKKYYEMVLNTNSEYEMIFNAKMNLALSTSNKNDLLQMKQSLVKMTKDEKNKDYLDRIYFTLAELYLLEKDTIKAIENYQLSTVNSIDNELQKSLSFLQLGKIKYNNKNYPQAKIFYDSAYIFMPEDHSKYFTVKEKQQVLESLINQLNTISLEDSLQKLSSMSVNEQKEIIKKIIDEIIQKEQQELINQQNLSYNNQQGRDGRNNNFGENVSGGKWYFYNPATLSFGLSEFRKKWGKRKLEDNWRRSNKKSINTEEQDSISTNKSNQNTNEKSEDYYLSKIPKTKKEIEESNRKIINAYYKASTIYKDDLNELLDSEKMLLELTNRFPENKEFGPIAHYLLYKMQINYSDTKAQKTKEKLITLFPNSNYAKTLVDTNYARNIKKIKLQKEEEYARVFEMYRNNKNLDALTACEEKLNNKKEDTIYLSKYYLISIFSKFNINKDTTTFISELKKGSINYSGTAASKRCLEILELMKNPEGFNRRNEIAILKSIYKYNTNSKHYICILIDQNKIDLSYINTLISDFNTDNFSDKIIEIEAMLLGIDKQIIVIKTFKNEKESKKYQNLLFSNNTILNELNKLDHSNFIISNENFIEFFKHKDIDGYQNFYNKKYHQEIN